MGKPGAERALDQRLDRILTSDHQELRRELYGSRTSNIEQAAQSVERARELVKVLEHALILMSEDDPAQPVVEDLQTVLRQAETRLGILEDWYERTYCYSSLSPHSPIH